MRLSVVILTKDEEHNISDCITSVQWADRVVVLDSESVDRTREIAREMGAKVYIRPFRDYADQRNAALEMVEGDWIFFVDADERATPELAAEVQEVIEDESRVGWWVPRHNYIFGRIIRHAGWYPDYQLRLLRRGYARYDPARPVHEVVMLDGEAGHLQNPLIHYNYHTLAEFRERQQRYTTYEAQALLEEGIRPRWRNFILQPLREFRLRYLTLQGYRDGAHGLLLSLLMAWYTFQRYRLLRSLRRNRS
ncbi:MAG: glycosyltransferase family 2 protein [Chloroflexota bacterium]|nr:glycosyltransferase family 2 protein [Chloroflexota bacterium]